ncbi:hypothetical protein [Aciditerrimonas ferrireducens]|nr:hypothetical protein [Aciditerrimonas ferrireducens]
MARYGRPRAGVEDEVVEREPMGRRQRAAGVRAEAAGAVGR